MEAAATRPQPRLTPEEAQKEIERRAVKELCKKDLFYLADNLLRDHDRGDHVPLGPMHRELCDHLMSAGELNKVKLLALEPRSHLKTTIGDEAYATWRIIRNPNIRILVVSAIEDNAQAFLDQIRSNFRDNEAFRRLFPELIPSSWGDKKKFTVSRKTRARGPTVEALGVGGSATSKHFDLIIYDDFFDLADPNITDPAEYLRRCDKWFEGSFFLLDNPKSDRVVIGTRWYFGDPYERLIESGAWKCLIRAIETEGVPLWPEKFPMDVIEEMREQFAQAGQLPLFWAQWYNDPVPKGEAKLGGYQLYEGTPPNNAGSPYLGCDPASSLDPKADYTAFVKIRSTPAREVYVLSAVQQRIDPDKIADLLFEYERDAGWDMMCGVEKVGMQKMIAPLLHRKMIETGCFFPTQEIPQDNKARKEWRIMGALQPIIAEGRLYVKKEHRDLIAQLERYPKVPHDDLLDALEMAIRMLPPVDPQYKIAEKPILPPYESREARLIREAREFGGKKETRYVHPDETMGSEW